MEERISFAQKPKPKFDIDKCPLLSKPGELYKRKMRMGSSTSNLNYPIFQVRSSSSQSNTHNSETSSTNSKTAAPVAISEEPSDELKTSNENLNSVAKGDQASSSSPYQQSEEGGQEEQQPSCLRNIYPSTRFKSNYSHLFITEHIADIFIYFTLNSGVKYMSHHDFRHFVK